MEIVKAVYNNKELKTINSAGNYFCLENSGQVINDRVTFVSSDGDYWLLDPAHFRGMCKRLKPSNAIKIEGLEWQLCINDGKSIWRNYFDVGIETERSWIQNNRPIGYDITDDWILLLNGDIYRLDDYLFSLDHLGPYGVSIPVGISKGNTDYHAKFAYQFKLKDNKLRHYLHLYEKVYGYSVKKDFRTMFDFIQNRWHEHPIDSSYTFCRLVKGGALYYKDLDLQIVKEDLFSSGTLITYNNNSYDTKGDKFLIKNPKEIKSFLAKLNFMKVIPNTNYEKIRDIEIYYIKTESQSRGYFPEYRLIVTNGVDAIVTYSSFPDTDYIDGTLQEGVFDYDKNYVIMYKAKCFIVRKSDNAIIFNTDAKKFGIVNGRFCTWFNRNNDWRPVTGVIW